MTRLTFIVRAMNLEKLAYIHISLLSYAICNANIMTVTVRRRRDNACRISQHKSDDKLKSEVSYYGTRMCI